jgi:hypothetical protein
MPEVTWAWRAAMLARQLASMLTPPIRAILLAESRAVTPLIGWVTLALAMTEETELAGHAGCATYSRACRARRTRACTGRLYTAEGRSSAVGLIQAVAKIRIRSGIPRLIQEPALAKSQVRSRE